MLVDGGMEEKDKVEWNCKIVTLDIDWINEIVFYNMRVYQSDTGEIIYLAKRYSQFRQLDKRLKKSIRSHHYPPLPPKEFVLTTDHTDPQFIEERRALLEYYLNNIFQSIDIRVSEPVNEFLTHNRLAERLSKRLEETYELDLIRSSPMSIDGIGVEVSNIWIPSTKRQRDHILYQLHWNTGDGEEDNNAIDQFNRWVVLKRYKDIYQMDKELRLELPSSVVKQLPLMPERHSKVIYDHLDPDFIEQRRVLLQNYMKNLLKIPDVQHCKAFLQFLNVDA